MIKNRFNNFVRFCFIWVFSVFSIITNAQVTSGAASIPKAQIKMLKNGALLIRLKTSENKINGLIRMGNTAGAENIKQQQYKENKIIADLFKKNFTFCKFYFFYSNQSHLVSAGKLNGILMNANLEVDSSYVGTDFLIGEFSESENNKIPGFISMDKNMEQLKKPFPFLVKQGYIGDSKLVKEEVIIKYDRQLNTFYNSCN